MIEFFQSESSVNSRWLRLVLACAIFVLIFWYPWQTQKNWQGHAYWLAPDTPGYIAFRGWLHPWRSARTIGYPAFLYPFLHAEREKFLPAYSSALKAGTNVWAAPRQPIYAMASETGIAEKFEMVALVQRVILALSISLFYLAVCRWFNPLFSFAALLAAILLAPPPDPRYILTEPLSCALTWLCAACLVAAPKSPRQTAFFALGCLCASLAYLVRPQTLSLTAICSLIFLYQVFGILRKRTLRALAKPVFTFCPLLLAYGYIGWLSVTGGQIFLHTHSDMHYASFCFFVEPDDAQYMPTERARKFAEWVGVHKEEFMAKVKNGEGAYRRFRLSKNASPARQRVDQGRALLYGFMPEVWKHFADEKGIRYLSLLQSNIFGKELNAGLRQRHAKEMVAHAWYSFIGGLGYYSDIWHLARFPRASFAINILALALSAVVITGCAGARWPVSLLVGIHLMAILAAAVGHFVISRYVEPTEPFLLLAGMCSLWTLCGWVYARLHGKGAGAAAGEAPAAS